MGVGTLTYQNIIDKAQELMVDETGTWYSGTQGVEWVNEATRAVCLVRPDACVETVAKQLAAGVKQSLPTRARRVMRLLYNTDSGGSAHLGAIFGPIDLRLWDRFDPTWGADANAAATIAEYAYNPAAPDHFWVNPPATTSAWVLGEFAMNPSAQDDVADLIQVEDVYSPALTHYVTAMWCLRDDERTPNHERARYHMEQFFKVLGVKVQSDALINPDLVVENA